MLDVRVIHHTMGQGVVVDTIQIYLEQAIGTVADELDEGVAVLQVVHLEYVDDELEYDELMLMLLHIEVDEVEVEYIGVIV